MAIRRADPALDTLAGQGAHGVTPAGGTALARSRGPVHRIPDEQPCCRQRHPADTRFDNIAHAACRAGYVPPCSATPIRCRPTSGDDPDDPRLSTYEGVLPGFDAVLDMSGWQLPWLQWLNSQGYSFDDPIAALECEHERPAELSTSTFLTDAFLGWLGTRSRPWFAHLSYLRPHPPFSAAGHFSTMYDPASCPPPQPTPTNRHPLYDKLLASPIVAAADDPSDVADMQSQYFGMISEVDAQLARVWESIEARGEWENTVIVVTSDHGEQLGDQGLIHKFGFYESATR